MANYSRIDTVITNFFHKNQQAVKGLILSAQYNGATVFCQGYGMIQENGSLPTTTNSFQIDSLTKALTAIAVLRLCEQGAIGNITDPLGNYLTALPEGYNWNPDWNTIQINQLLAMASGIPDDSNANLSYLQILSHVAGEPTSPPGVEYVYSDPNFFLLGALIDQLVGPTSSYETYIQQEVLNVFVMPNTGLIPFSAAQNPAMPFYENAWSTWRNPDSGYSSGGFASTMGDLEAFAIGLANGAVLQQASYQLMWTPYTLSDGSPCPFGLGWNVTNNPNGTLNQVLKNGGGWGWSSALGYSPPNAVGSSAAASASVLMNGTTGGADTLVSEIIALVIQANQ
jgi:CubicO group peptidase (beta-lactamase class C family)